MKIHLDIPAEETRIELVPLIDVIFCILTFFLIAALQLTRQQAINVDLPKAKTGQTQMREMLIVSIDGRDQISIEDKAVNDQQFDQRLKTFQTTNPAGLMVLYAPENARYAKVVEVLDKLREVGGERVALATLPSSAPSPQPNPSVPNSGIPATPGTGNQVQPLPSQGATPSNPGGPQFGTPGQQQFNPNQFQSPLPAPGQQQPSNSGANLGIPPVSPAPIAPNRSPGASTPQQNIAPQN